MTTMIMTNDTCDSWVSSRGMSCAVAINVVLIAVNGHNESMRSFQFLNKTMSSYPNARVPAPKDLRYPPPSCSMVYPDNNNDDNGGSSKKNHSNYNGVTSLCWGGGGGGGGQ